MNGIFDALPGIMISAFKDRARGVYTSQSGAAPVTVELNFDQLFRQIIEQDGVPVEVMRKAATLKASDIPPPRHGDTLFFKGETYTVRSIIPAAGLVTVILSE